MTLQEFSQSLNAFYEKGYDKKIKDLSSMLSVVRKYVLKSFKQIDDVRAHFSAWSKAIA